MVLRLGGWTIGSGVVGLGFGIVSALSQLGHGAVMPISSGVAEMCWPQCGHSNLISILRLFGGQIWHVLNAERRFRGGGSTGSKSQFRVLASVERSNPAELAGEWHVETFESLDAPLVFGVLG